MYKNPIPVVVVCIPVMEGFLLIKRNIPPKEGEWAFPGGYVDYKETVQEAGRREVKEEIGMDYQGNFSIVDILSSTDKEKMLIFLKMDEKQNKSIIEKFVPNSEVSELKIVTSYEELCFPTHSEILKKLL